MHSTWTRAIPMAVTLVLGTIIGSTQSGAADASCLPSLMMHSELHQPRHNASMMHYQAMGRGGMMMEHQRHMKMMNEHGVMRGGIHHAAMMRKHHKSNRDMSGATKGKQAAARPSERAAVKSTHTGH